MKRGKKKEGEYCMIKKRKRNQKETNKMLFNVLLSRKTLNGFLRFNLPSAWQASQCIQLTMEVNFEKKKKRAARLFDTLEYGK